MRYFFAIIVALLVFHDARSQSDYGWFTGKASVFTCTGHSAGGSFHYYYNMADRLSVGTGLGVRGVCGHGGVLVPVTGAMKVGLTDRRAPVMPVLQLMAGYSAGASGYSGFYAEERLGVETTKIARIRFAFDLGCAHIHDAGACFMVSAGILF